MMKINNDHIIALNHTSDLINDADSMFLAIPRVVMVIR